MTMQDVLAISLQSMHGDMARLDQVSMNLANGLTPGYKRGVAIQKPMAMPFAQALDAAATARDAQPAQASAGVVGFAPDLREGTLRSTGQQMDVAIVGSGYFEVLTEQGPAYTRQGSFRVNAQGKLVTAQGQPVMGRGGEIFLSTSNPTIAANGLVTENTSQGSATPVGQLKVVQFEPNARLERMGDGLFSADAGMTLVSDDKAQVRQGYLENSNVNSAYEMTQLLQTMRHFESMSRVAQSYDEIVGTAIRKLGDNA